MKEAGPVVICHNVGMRYSVGPEVLRDVNFSLLEGSFTFLSGMSGAGKSSLLRLLHLSHQPHRGDVILFGHNVRSLTRRQIPEFKKHIGAVFQEFHLLDHLTAFENVALPLRIRHFPQKTIKKHVDELLAWVGLDKVTHAKPSLLSGGQKQRLCIARAVISRPRLLVADEPTGNVDDVLAHRLLYLFEELNRMGTTVFIATHNQRLIREFHYPVLTLKKGQLVSA